MSRDSQGGRVRAAYDAVAEVYAEAISDELASRPIECGLLEQLVRDAQELGSGQIADIGCGPGHVTGFLTDRGADVFGFDLAPAMVTVARAQFPELDFRVGSMLGIDAQDASLSGGVAFYSIIHLAANERLLAYREFARVLQPKAPLLVSFHVSAADQPVGSTLHLESFFEIAVDLDGYFLDPATVLAELQRVGFELRARLDREAISGDEYPSRRCYLLMRRVG